MELGPRDRISQAFWHKNQKNRTIATSQGEVVYLDLRHLDEATINQHLPFIRELAKAYTGIDPVNELIPVRPTAHYTMGDIKTDINCATKLKGLYAIGECASVGLHGANRLGSNSLSEIIVFGEIAGQQAINYIYTQSVNFQYNVAQATAIKQHLTKLVNHQGTEHWAKIRHEMGVAMDQDCGVYRSEQGMQQTINTLTN